MRVLIIKLTSMGDLMHALPALTDAATIHPDITFDWVVDKAFSAVPKWHPSVDRVITTNHRQWRKNWWSTFRNGELSAFHKLLNEHDYDLVIDMQNNLKSALVSFFRKGVVTGLDKQSCREKPAHWAYRKQIAINPEQHAVVRMRQILAKGLGYAVPSTPADYGVSTMHCEPPKLDFKLPERYLFLVHNASWQTKLWPVEHWQKIVQLAAAEGISTLIPCGNDEEYRRAQQIASVNAHAYALPKMHLDHVVAIMQNALAAICSDTGLAHMAAMLNLPAVTVYGSTDTQLIGTFGENQSHLVSQMSCTPCYKRRCPLPEASDGDPVCMDRLTPQQVWDRLQSFLPAQ